MDGGRIVFGVRPVEELCRARPREVSVVYLAEGTRSPETERVVQVAKERGVSVEIRPRRLIAELAKDGVHQGLVAITGRFRYASLEDLLNAARLAGEAPLLVLLDGITDPHNLGAIVRSAEVLGAHGVVIPSRNSASVTPGAVKASAGATERVPIAEVGNLLKSIDTLREAGVRVLGAGAGEGERLAAADLTVATALVVGAEGRGMREAVARRCDALFHIPQRGVVASLNASVAAAVALYEAARQRLEKDPERVL
ncbi:MAG TPA: 23S rRNA (guanosine(2251)-2'-O)-methyltransferase RlmB [Polyangia bacterium]|nr:23S rRNA (guanosine(2251)-2'-O)-methyltransferase RlmB [Polyangia bacterium]